MYAARGRIPFPPVAEMNGRSPNEQRKAASDSADARLLRIVYRLEYRFLYQFLTVKRGNLLPDLQEIDVQMKAGFSLISFDRNDFCPSRIIKIKQLAHIVLGIVHRHIIKDDFKVSVDEAGHKDMLQPFIDVR